MLHEQDNQIAEPLIRIPDLTNEPNQLMHLRGQMRGTVYGAFAHSFDPEELIARTYQDWRSHNMLDIPFFSYEHDAYERLYNSSDFLDADGRILRHASAFGADKEFLLRVAAGSDLIRTSEIMLRNHLLKQRSNGKRFSQPTVATTEGRVFRVPQNLLSDQSATDLVEIESTYGVACFADSNPSAFLAEQNERIAELTGHLPNLSRARLTALFFLNDLPAHNGTYFPDFAVIRIGTGVASSRTHAERVAKIFGTYTHELEHAYQPELLSVIAELDAFGTQFEELQKVGMALPTSYFGNVGVDYQKEILEESFVGLQNSSALMERVVGYHMPIQGRLLADHNIGSEVVKNNWLFNHPKTNQ